MTPRIGFGDQLTLVSLTVGERYQPVNGGASFKWMRFLATQPGSSAGRSDGQGAPAAL